MKLLFLTSIGGTAPGSVGGNPPSQQATPLVDDGFLYIDNGWQEVVKIDVRSGSRGLPIWSFSPEPATELPGAMRGVAMLGNNVYVSTRDARLISVDRDSGEPWFEVNTKQAGTPDNQRHSGAPLAVKDMIIVGNSRGSGGTRAWIGAFGAGEGDHRWTFWVIPGPGEPGHESWADDHNAYLTGGGGGRSGPRAPTIQRLSWCSSAPAIRSRGAIPCSAPATTCTL